MKDIYQSPDLEVVRIESKYILCQSPGPGEIEIPGDIDLS